MSATNEVINDSLSSTPDAPIQLHVDPLNITTQGKRSSRRMANGQSSRRTGSNRYPDLTPAAPLINHVLEKNSSQHVFQSIKHNRHSHSNKHMKQLHSECTDDIELHQHNDKIPSLLRTNTSKSEHHPSLMNAIITNRVDSLRSLQSDSSANNFTHTTSYIDTWLNKHKRIQYVINKINDFGALNLLLSLIPVALALHYTNQHPAAQFITACLAIMPLAGWMGDATESISDTLGPSAGGIMNATFGNAAELIVALFALYRNEDVLVRASLVGSIISNVLLVLGCAIFAGGVKYKIQTFNKNGTSVGSTMLVVAIVSVLLPAIYHVLMVYTDPYTNNGTASLPMPSGMVVGQLDPWLQSNIHNEQRLSLGISCVLIITYILTLFFQLHTHSFFYDEIDAAQQAELTVAMMRTANNTDKQVTVNISNKSSDNHNKQLIDQPINDQGEPTIVRTSSSKVHPLPPAMNNSNSINGEIIHPRIEPIVAIDIESTSNDQQVPTQRVSSLQPDIHSIVPAQSEIEDVDSNAEMSVKKAIIILTIATVFVGLLSDVLTGAVTAAGVQMGLTETFMGIVIVAIVGNAAEHWSAVTCAMNNKLDLSLSIAFGSALQVTMFVLPVVVLCSYARSQPMVLVLPLLESFSLVGSVILAWMVVQSGGTNWLEGLMLLMIYLILALAFYYEPVASEPLT